MIRDTSTMDRTVDRGTISRRRVVLGSVAAGVAVMVLGLLYPSLQRWASSEAAVELGRLRIGEVTRGDLIRDISVEGRVVAAYRPTLFSQTEGIADLLVESGSRVEKGQALVRISSPELESELKRAESNLSSTKSDLERQRILAQQAHLQNEQAIGLLQVELEAARRGMARAQKSRDEGILNAVEYEKAHDEVRVAELKLDVALKRSDFEAQSWAFEIENRVARVEAQQLAVDEHRRLVDDLVVRSPAAGLVSRVEIEDRDAVGPNEPLLGVVDLSAFEVQIFVPEHYADDVVIPTRAEISSGGVAYEGEVRSLSPEVEGSRVEGTVRFVGEAPAGLIQNQRLPVRLLLDRRRDVVKVPRGPFVESGGGRTVYVVKDGMAALRSIEIGVLSVTEVEIASGLEPGERIVLSDLSRFEGANSILLRR